jgi:hypothetical protein
MRAFDVGGNSSVNTPCMAAKLQELQDRLLRSVRVVSTIRQEFTKPMYASPPEQHMRSVNSKTGTPRFDVGFGDQKYPTSPDVPQEGAAMPVERPFGAHSKSRGQHPMLLFGRLSFPM